MNNRSVSGDGGSGANSSMQNRVSIQPVKIKALLDMYEDEEDDSDNGNDDSEEENEEEPENKEIGSELSKVSDYAEQPGNNKIESKQCDYPKHSDFPESSHFTRPADCPKLSDFSKKSDFTKSSDFSKQSELVRPLETIKQSEHSRSSQFNHHLDYHTKSHTSETGTSAGSSYTSAHPANYSWQNSDRCSTKKEATSELRGSISGFTSDFGKMDVERMKSEPIQRTEAPQHNVYGQGHTFESAMSKNHLHAFDAKNQAISFDSSSSSKNDKSLLSYTIKHTKSEAPDMLHSTVEKHLHGAVSYKTDGSYSQRSHIAESNNPPETPHKNQGLPGNTRPVPSSSHRNIFQTPQTKIGSDMSRHFEQTPTSTLSAGFRSMYVTGSEQDGKTPGKYMMPAKDDWRRNEERSVRRPLVETVPADHRPTNAHPDSALLKDTALSTISDRHALGTICEKTPSQRKSTKENLCPEMAPRRQESYQEPKSHQDTYKERSHQKQDLAPARNPDPPKKPAVQASIPRSISSYQYGKKLSIKGREYVILGTLGQGMSGEVYRVQDLSNLELKAIKYVNLARMDAEAAQSCLDEIKMLHKLQAPTVVKMFDHEVRNQSIYVVMEMGDTDLSRFLKSVAAEKRRLPLTMILYYWTEMLMAVKHIHDNGVIHSDLKPANFLLVRGRLKLIDFGISSTLNAEMTSVVKSTTVGTLNYISPEALMDVSTGDSPHQNTRYKISYKSDVWSLGCILYSLVFGNTPFQSYRTQWAKINAITNPNPMISYQLPSNAEQVPIILIDVIKMCLRHDPKARPSVEQLLQVQYISVAKNSGAPRPDIPSDILTKIRRTLDDDEWKKLLAVFDKLSPH